MVTRRLICTRCKYKWETAVVDPNEAAMRSLPTHPIVCPECKGGPVKFA